jgi:phosphoserine phosphatase/DNA-binding NarL/FixJ family response regulator
MSDSENREFNPRVLIVDDEESLLNSLNRILSRLGIDEKNILKAKNAGEAIEILEGIIERRERIEMVISDMRMPGEQNGVDVVKKAKEIDPPPFVAVISGTGEEPEAKGFSDIFVGKPYNTDDIKNILAQCRRYWESLEAGSADKSAFTGAAAPAPAPATDTPQRTVGRSPSIPPPLKNKDDAKEILSPFPPLKKFDTHNPLKIKGENLPLALFDLDGTLTRGSTRDIIMLHGFVRRLYKTHDENLWKPLMDRFDDWLQVEIGMMSMEEYYEKWDPRKKKEEIDPYEFYEEQIEKTSKIFGYNLKEIPVKKIKEEAEKYIKEILLGEKSPFHDYAKTIIRDTDDRGIYSTIISGSPDFLVEIIARNIGAHFYFGMEFDMEKRKNGENEDEAEEFFTGGVRYITGKKEAKKRVTDKLSEEGHIILFGMGNRDADEPLAKASMSSMLVNLDKRDDKHFRRYCYTETRNNKITICDVATQAVIDTYRDRISGVMRKKGNIVKFRDLLLKMKPDTEGEKRNFNLEEVLEMLNKFYGYTAVYDTLKLDLQKTHPDYLANALHEIGIPEEIIAEVDEAIRFYQETGRPWKDDDDETE